MAPEDVAASAGLIRALTAAGRREEAQAVLDALDPKLAEHALLAQARAGLALAEDAPDDSELAALRAAAALVDPEGRHSSMIERGSHPDILSIRRLPKEVSKEDEEIDPSAELKRSISIDQIRSLQASLTTRPGLADKRAVIIDAADDLERSGANALLKSLEEPPAGTYFLLISHASDRLLPTIRSRCRSLALSPLGPEDLLKAVRGALEAAGKPAIAPADFQALAPFAGGSPRRLLAMADGGGLALQAKIAKVFEGLPSLDLKVAHALADELQPAAQEQKFELFYDLFLSFLARLVRAGAAQAGERSEVALSNRIMGEARLATFAHLWETLARDKADALLLNLDRKSLILDTLSKLEAAARS